jgi:citrate synthase
VLIIMWAITRIPGNPITGRGGPISEMAIAIEVFQVVYIIITAIIITKESKSSISQTIKDERLNK